MLPQAEAAFIANGLWQFSCKHNKDIVTLIEDITGIY